MALNSNAVEVLEARYLLRHQETGELVEDPDGMFTRVAQYISAVETPANQGKYFEIFKHMMVSGQFLPNSPTLANSGRPNAQLSACFVLPVDDSMEGIFDTLRNMALIHKSGGGTGFSFSRLRGKGSSVSSTHGVATGPIPFMRLYNEVSETVKQGGMRHGANMGILNWQHPDILDFIRMKDQIGELVNFNISVGTTEDFWSPANQEMQQMIAESAWLTGDPGLVFLDHINGGTCNPVPSLGPIEATNPCGEQPLYPYDSCNLGSINLAEFHRQDGHVNWDELGQCVDNAVRFLDNVVTANHYPHPLIDSVSMRIRRIGLGVMGWADLLIKCKIPYGHIQAFSLASDVMNFINKRALGMSAALGVERGSFPSLRESIYNGMPALRNSTRTTIAPTGTISIIAGCSSGIEPVYAYVMERRHKIDRNDPSRDVVMEDIHPLFKEWMNENPGFQHTGEALQGRPSYMPEAMEIPWEQHLQMQAAFQAHTDNAVSKTINMPNTASVKDVRDAYEMAYNSGCMGITIYRDGCRDTQVLKTMTASSPVTIQMVTEQNFTISERRRLPREAKAIRKKFRVADHEGYIHAGMYEDGALGEVFVKMNRTGDTVSNLMDELMMAVSIGLQYGVPLKVLVDKYRNSNYEPHGLTDDPEIRTASSLTDYVFRWLESRFGLKEASIADSQMVISSVTTVHSPVAYGCPICGGKLIKQEGCEKCSDCDYNRCS